MLPSNVGVKVPEGGFEKHEITKTFKFPDFREALKFVNHVGELAEEQGHHPDISLAWGRVEITAWTHKINGLTESDFILAAKINHLYNPELHALRQPRLRPPRSAFFWSNPTSPLRRL